VTNKKEVYNTIFTVEIFQSQQHEDGAYADNPSYFMSFIKEAADLRFRIYFNGNTASKVLRISTKPRIVIVFRFTLDRSTLKNIPFFGALFAY